MACVVRDVGWAGQSALKMFSWCSPGTEVFRIAQTEAGAPFSKACSCEVVLEKWRASQSRRLLFKVFILLTLLSLCLRNFDGALLSAAFLSFVMLSLILSAVAKRQSVWPYPLVVARHTVRRQFLRPEMMENTFIFYFSLYSYFYS